MPGYTSVARRNDKKLSAETGGAAHSVPWYNEHEARSPGDGCPTVTTMIRVRIRQGQVELLDPIPEDWEGQTLQIVELTPDEPMPDIEEALAALKASGRPSTSRGSGK